MNTEAITARAVDRMSAIPEIPCEPGYRLHHGARAQKLALEIAEAEGLTVDRDALAMGALLHDIGKGGCPENESHAYRGAAIIQEAFRDLMDDTEREAVSEIVAHHYERPLSKWYADKEKPVWNNEILLVQDADVLDHFGIAGIWLALHWAAHKQFTPDQTIQEWETSAYMCAWREEARRSLNFKTSRRLLELRIAEMDDFFRRLH